MMLLRNLSLGKIVLLLVLWFFLLQPLLFQSYNRLVACYWWMRP